MLPQRSADVLSILMPILILCGAGLLFSLLLMMSYGLDLSPELF